MENINHTPTQFEQTRQTDKINQAHSEALHSDKLGKRLARKTIKLIESGKTERRFVSPRLGFNFAEPTSTTLALNVELKKREIDATAKVERPWEGTVSDAGQYNKLSLKEVEGRPVVNTDHR